MGLVKLTTHIAPCPALPGITTTKARPDIMETKARVSSKKHDDNGDYRY